MTTPHKDDSLPLNGCHQHMQYLPDCEDCKFRQPKDDSQLDELRKFHPTYCDKYEVLRGIYPNDRRETGKPCSCGFEALIAKAVQEADRLARLDEWYGINTSRDDMCEGIKTDRGGQNHASVTTDYITGKERIAALQAAKAPK